MKYSDEQINEFLKGMNVNLYPMQKEILKRIVNGEKLYVVMPRNYGRSVVDILVKKFREMYEGGEND